jgi:hypothetical protein
MKNKNKSLKMFSGVLLSFALFAFVFNFNNKADVVHDAELRFAESSESKNIKGSILPASCESYPVMGTAAHFAGDTSFYCAGTVPTPVVNIRFQ